MFEGFKDLFYRFFHQVKHGALCAYSTLSVFRFSVLKARFALTNWRERNENLFGKEKFARENFPRERKIPMRKAQDDTGKLYNLQLIKIELTASRSKINVIIFGLHSTWQTRGNNKWIRQFITCKSTREAIWIDAIIKRANINFHATVRINYHHYCLGEFRGRV